MRVVSLQELVSEGRQGIILLSAGGLLRSVKGGALPNPPEDLQDGAVCVSSETVLRLSEIAHGLSGNVTPSGTEQAEASRALSVLKEKGRVGGHEVRVLLRDSGTVRAARDLMNLGHGIVEQVNTGMGWSSTHADVHTVALLGTLRQIDGTWVGDRYMRVALMGPESHLRKLIGELYAESLFHMVSTAGWGAVQGYRAGPFAGLAATIPRGRKSVIGRKAPAGMKVSDVVDTNVLIHDDSKKLADRIGRSGCLMVPNRVEMEILAQAKGSKNPKTQSKFDRANRKVVRRAHSSSIELSPEPEPVRTVFERHLQAHRTVTASRPPGLTDEQVVLLALENGVPALSNDRGLLSWGSDYSPEFRSR